MPRSTRSAASTPSRRRPSNQISPCRGVSRPATVLSSVLLPAPLAPTSATASPARTSRVTPWSATTPVPYATWASRISSSGRPVALGAGTVAVAEIRRDHALVPRDLGREPLGQLLAAVEHDHPMRERHHHFHYVLHDADGETELAVDAAHQLD